MPSRSSIAFAPLAMLAWLSLCPAVSAQTPDELKAEAGRYMDRNEYEKAIETYSRIPDTAPIRSRIDKHLGRALALMDLVRYADVQPEIDKARALADQLGLPEGQARVENMDGQYLNKTRGGDRGIDAFQRAAVLAEKSGNRQLLAAIYSALGSAYGSFEDWEHDTYYAQKSYDLRDKPTDTDRFNFLMEQGIGQFELYERDASEARYLEALDLANAMGAKRNQAFAIGELAFLYWTFDHDTARALALYRDAIALAEEARTVDLQATDLLNRGNVFRDTGDYEAALADYRKSIAMSEATDLNRGTFPQRKNIGQIYRLMGKPRDAVAALEALIKDAPRYAVSPRHMWQARMELASSYEAIGEREQAEANYRSMLNVLEEQRNTAILDAFRTGTFAHALSAYDPYDRYIRFLLSASPPRAAAALDIAERARARSFIESLASVRASVAATLPARLLAREGEIRRAISAVQEQLRNAGLGKADRDRLLGDLGTAEQQRENFILAMRVEHPAIAEARYPELQRTDALQQQLRPGETAIVFYLGQPNSFRWVVTSGRVDLSLLPARADIEKQADRVRGLLRTPSDLSSVRSESTALAALLFAGLRLDGDGPLAIVPHGVLHYIPFEALPLDGKLLIEKHPVSYAPSLNALVFLRRLPPQQAPFRVLAVGNPTVDSSKSAPARSGDVDNLALLGALPYSGRELNEIRDMFWARTDVLSGPSATESALRRESLSQFPVVHFATHGLVNDLHPKRSGLLLSPESGEDGLLQMGEIYGLGLHANLVVLSACETALGKEVTGEGIVGLSRAFFFAGARSVVAALWNLNDRFTSEFVERFYRELGHGHAPEEALRQAKLAYLNHAQFGHPFYWSSLVLMGDGTPVLPTGPLGQPWWPTALAVLLTLAAAGLTVRSRGR